MALLVRNSQSALYRGLSSFWIKYFKDSSQLDSIYAGAEQLFSQVYLDLMELILSKSLTTTPVFKREEYKLLIIQDDGTHFSPAVASNATRQIGQTTFKVTADSAVSSFDGIVIIITDLDSVYALDRSFLPYVGTYNEKLTGKSTNSSVWHLIVPSNKTVVDCLKDLKSQVVSNKKLTTVTTGTDAIFTLSFNEGEELLTVTITSAERALCAGTVSSLVHLLNTKITHNTISVSLEAGLVIIKTSVGNTLRVTSANTATEELLHFTAFPFKVEVDIPVEAQATTMWDFLQAVQLATSGFQAVGSEYRYSLGGPGTISGLESDTEKYLRSSKYMTSTLYDPSLILENNKDYRIADGYVYFKNNPFALSGVAQRVINNKKQIAFWMGDVLYDNSLLYERYGHRFVERRESSEAYKLLIRGILFYYTNGPDVFSITSALNLVAGIPVVLENDEKVISRTKGTGSAPSVVVTDRNTYEVPNGANFVVNVGDTVNAFDVLVDAFKVEDYVTSPTWFDHFVVPESLMPGITDEQRQLKKSVTIPVIGDSTFIVGDTNPSASVLVTDPIEPYGSNPSFYALSSAVYFEVEIPAVRVKIPVLIPPTFTITTSTLSELAAVITNATKQVTCIPSTGHILDAPATFVFNSTTITVPTSGAYTSISSIIDVINGALPSGFTAFLNPDGKTIMFASSTGQSISIHSVSATAHNILGIVGVKSFLGINVEADGDKLVFSNKSVESDALLRISNMNADALTKLNMKPFSTGSGDMVGKTTAGVGQPNLSYKLFDDILKYTTFKVSFNLSNLDAKTNLDSIVDIVMQGRPKYVTPFVTPVNDFSDTISGLQDITTIDDGDGNPDTVDIVPFADRNSFPPTGHSYNNEYFNVQTGVTSKFNFSSYDGVRVQYDSNMEEAKFAVLGTPGVSVPVWTATSTTLRIDSKDGLSLGRINHRITFAVQDNLLPEDRVYFTYPGIYNYGVQDRGKAYGPKAFSDNTTIPGGSSALYGIFAADLSWVHGTEKTELDTRVTHMFIMDSFRPDSIKELGFGEGDRVTLEGDEWSSGNKGTFTILNVTYEVTPPANVTTTSGKVDILWIQNSNGVVENSTLGTPLGVGAKYTFSYKPGWVGKRWFVTIPYDATKSSPVTVSEMLQAFEKIKQDGSLSDDSELFPFDLSYVGEDHAWSSNPSALSTSYLDVYTGHADLEEYSFIGERWQFSREWQRKFFIGASYTDYFTGSTLPYKIGPRKWLIGGNVPAANARYVGESANVVNDTSPHIVGTPLTYHGGDFSTVDHLKVTPIPYTP